MLSLSIFSISVFLFFSSRNFVQVSSFFFYCFIFEWSCNWCCFSAWFLGPLLGKWVGWLGDGLAYVLCFYFHDLRETNWCAKAQPENYVSLICCNFCPMNQIIWCVLLWWNLRSSVVLNIDDLPFLGKPCSLVILEFKMMLDKGLTFYFLGWNAFFLVQVTWFLTENWAVLKAISLSVGSRFEDCGFIYVERRMSNFLHCWSVERRLE